MRITSTAKLGARSKPTAKPVDDDDDDDTGIDQARAAKARARRAAEEEDDDEPRPSKRTELAVLKTSVAAAAPSRITPEIEKALQSRFGGKSEVIIAALENEATDGTLTLLSRSLLQMLLGVIPTLEHQIQSSRGRYGVHGLSIVVSSVRDMLNELRAVQDRGNLGQTIVERNIRPSYMNIGTQIMLAITELESNAKSRMTPEDFNTFRAVAEDRKRQLANYIQAQYDDVSQSVVSSLS